MSIRKRVIALTTAGMILVGGALTGCTLVKKNNPKEGSIATPTYVTQVVNELEEESPATPTYVTQAVNELEEESPATPTYVTQAINELDIDKMAKNYANLLATNGITPDVGDINTFYGVDTMVPLIKDAILYINEGDGPIDYHPTKANLEATSREDVYNDLINVIEFYNRNSDGKTIPIRHLFAGCSNKSNANGTDLFIEQLYKNGGYEDDELIILLADKSSVISFDNNDRVDQLLRKYIIISNYALKEYGKEKEVKSY